MEFVGRTRISLKVGVAVSRGFRQRKPVSEAVKVRLLAMGVYFQRFWRSPETPLKRRDGVGGGIPVQHH